MVPDVNHQRVPVIAIDGPSASGKGTVAQLVAGALGFHYLDSGALYRAVAVAARRAGVDWGDEPALAPIAKHLDIRFDGDRVCLGGADVTDDLRTEQASEGASRVSAHPAVRAALLERQHTFRAPPGLVADGRDMGSVVFPDAALKIFLTAEAEERARRRYKQLIGKGLSANMAALLQDIRARDLRDSSRAAAPLQITSGAKILDTTQMSIAASVDRVVAWFREVQ